MAIATLAIGTVGMSVSAYAPTITRNFTVGNSTATGTLYRDSTQATAKTSLSGGRCSVTLIYCGKSVSYSDYISATPLANIQGSSGSASSTHYASKGGYSNSISMTA